MKKKGSQKGIAYGVLMTVPAFFLLLEEYLMAGQLCIQGSDARVYISIADNYISTGHFIQTARPYIGMVVPPGTPFMITLFRLAGLSAYGVMAVQILLFGLSNIMLFETGERISGRGLWAPIFYSLACMRCYLRLGVVMVEHYYLFLLCFAIWTVYKKMTTVKKIILLNVVGLAMVFTRPILSPVYLVILLYTIYWCWKNRNYKIGTVMILMPILMMGFNITINYRETGEYIFLENYSGCDLYFASRPDAPVTIKESSMYIVDEPDINRVQEDSTMTFTERNEFFKSLARQNCKNNFGAWLRNSFFRGYELFLKKYAFATLFPFCGGLLLAVREQKQKNCRGTIILILTLMLAVLTSLGIVELRYTLVIWPMASIHGAYLAEVLLRSAQDHQDEPEQLT